MTKLVGYETFRIKCCKATKMKLTTKCHYAVTAMLDLVLHDDGTPIKVEALAKRHGIPAPFLERLTGMMRQKGLLKSVRGPGGGYLLGKSPEEITVADIIHAVDDDFDARRCQGKGNCHKGVTCLTHHLWEALNHEMFSFLNTMTLAKLSQLPNIQSIALRVNHDYQQQA